MFLSRILCNTQPINSVDGLPPIAGPAPRRSRSAVGVTAWPDDRRARTGETPVLV